VLEDELNTTTQDSRFKTREEYEQWKEQKIREIKLKSSMDDFGIPCYPGAKSDGDTQAACAAPETGAIEEREEKSGLMKSKHCYRTNDPFATVVKFYKKQKGLKGGIVVDDEHHKSASFCLSKTGECNEESVGTSVAVSSPWFVPPRMKMNNDLLIVITNRVKDNNRIVGHDRVSRLSILLGGTPRRFACGKQPDSPFSCRGGR